MLNDGMKGPGAVLCTNDVFVPSVDDTIRRPLVGATPTGDIGLPSTHKNLITGADK